MQQLSALDASFVYLETTETPMPTENTRNGPPPMPIPTPGSNGGWKQVPTNKTTGSNG